MAKQVNAAEALREASKGLMMPSELETSFEVIELDGEPKPDRLRRSAGAPKSARVEEVTVDTLFLTVPAEDEDKFQRLRQAIQSQLSGAKAYKVGDEPERQVFIVGKSSAGLWVGLKTTVTET
jgi:hypothetical protein